MVGVPPLLTAGSYPPIFFNFPTGTQADMCGGDIGALRQFISWAEGSEEAKGMLRGGEAVGLRVAITEHTI